MLGTKTREALATKAATELTTGFAGWQLDVETRGFTALAFLLNHEQNTSATSITFRVDYSDDGSTYYPVGRVTSGNALEDDTIAWTVSAADTITLRVLVPDVRFVRLSAQADAVDGGANTDTLSARVVGGIA